MAAAAGFVLGFMNFVLAFFAAGLGHGSYIPLGVAAAPLTLLSMMSDSIALAFFGLVPLWGVYGVLADYWGESGKAAARGRKLLIAHNILGLLLVTLGPRTAYTDWQFFAQYWFLETFYLALYAAGQWMAWRLLPRIDAGHPAV